MQTNTHTHTETHTNVTKCLAFATCNLTTRLSCTATKANELQCRFGGCCERLIGWILTLTLELVFTGVVIFMSYQNFRSHIQRYSVIL